MAYEPIHLNKNSHPDDISESLTSGERMDGISPCINFSHYYPCFSEQTIGLRQLRRVLHLTAAGASHLHSRRHPVERDSRGAAVPVVAQRPAIHGCGGHAVRLQRAARPELLHRHGRENPRQHHRERSRSGFQVGNQS
ncbi:unnamed protein product [Closterium sp. NIES-53]